ncbi:ParB/RepB/Spo0J family partition protein [Psychrobacillus sp. NPDC096426]|uniref:ParB/RepB/Spo0J family partition protein n=1 Tax=Psychrobacillus sp. NPDC096426 TaxID=3364491 RepID=UPI00380591C4
MEKIKLIWVSINDVIPNPLNPRKNHSTKSEEMQRIIKSKGWETGITCYKKESKYVILSGHRRWFAAQQLGIKEIPVLLVHAPKSEAEELDRLGSVQGGKVDWSVYEWSKYTYEMWIVWNKCSYKELAHKMNISESQIASRVKVFQYYPHSEIEEKLANGIYTLSALYTLIIWLDKLQKEKPNLVKHYKEEMIRKTMLRKIEMKLVSVNDLRNETFIELSSDEHMTNFLLHPEKRLSDVLYEISGEEVKYRNNSRLKTHLMKLNNKQIQINKMDFEESKDAKILLSNLSELQKEILNKQEELKKILGK